MAVEDSGIEKRGYKVEFVSADHQNKPDVGSAIARQWYDTDKVDVIVDVPNSGVALAVNQITKDKGKVFLAVGPGIVGPDRQGVLAEHRALDVRHVDARQRHRQRDRRSRAATRGSSSPPTTRSAMRWSATPTAVVTEERRQGAGQGPRAAQHAGLLARSCCRRRRRRRRSSASPTPAATRRTRSSRRPSSASSRAARTSPACSCSSPTSTRSGLQTMRRA